MRLRLPSVAILLLFLSACSSTPQVYQLMGLQPATGPVSEDGVFQDFSSDTDTLARIWTDPDALMHEGKSSPWARVNIDRSAEMAHLSVDFNRTGYGVSIEVAPNSKTPERIKQGANLVVDLKSKQTACVGLRIMEADGEIWAYGKPPLDYQRLCLSGEDQWQTFELPLTAQHWFKFIYGGNTNHGNQQFDGDLIAMMSFELGLDGTHYFAPGEATIDIRQIRLLAGSEASAAKSAVATR